MTTVKLVNETPEGIKLYSIESEVLKMEAANIGCRIMSLYAPDKNGKMDDVVNGVKGIDDIKNDTAFMGAVVGRVANRIKNGRFLLNGKEYTLFQNDNNNTLHGGKEGFDKKIFDTEIVDNGVKFTYVSPDMEEGFPGTLTLNVTYTIVGDTFQIDYEYSSDKDTIANFTNHVYFNLSDNWETIRDHNLKINASKIGKVDSQCMGIGEFMDVTGTPFDFRESKKVGQDIDKDCEQLKNGSGYDHPYIFDGPGEMVLSCDETGRRLTITTDMPGAQFYSGNFLHKSTVAKHGKVYNPNAGLALETQFLPNSINVEEKPDVILKAGEVKKSFTKYKFDIM